MVSTAAGALTRRQAMETALGMSYAGKRSMVCMKHVGMNVCADAFVNAAITGVNGGLLVVAADDPSMHSSQNEQDSRFYGMLATMPIFEPSSQQEAYDMVSQAFDMSERLQLPVLMRIVTRLAHSRAAVVTDTQMREPNALNPDTDKRYVLLPAMARKQDMKLIGKRQTMEKEAESSPFNSLELKGKGTGIVACGIGYNYVMEAAPENVSGILKISQYPLPVKHIETLASASDNLLVVEDGQPFTETNIRKLLGKDTVKIEGKLTGHLPRTGELTPDNVARALGKETALAYKSVETVVGRPPALRRGCGHRDVYKALNEVVKGYPGARIFGDIGCYTLGALPPFQSISTCVDMGVSITMAKGAADAGLFPAIAIIGDSTFTHSGMTGLLDAVNKSANITVVISDNLTTAMTGGQDSAGTNKFEAICIGLGVKPEHVRVVVPLPKNMDEITRTIREEINYNGVSVIIPRRECMQTMGRHKKASQESNNQ